MKLVQHLKIGNIVLNSLDRANEEEEPRSYLLNRSAFLIGTIAPDLNCVYPAHRLKTTEKRFYKRVEQANKPSISLIRSFKLGIITHYVCDYFCYAHTSEALGLKHKKYEKQLYKYYLAHLQEIKEDKDKLLDKWLGIKKYNIDNVIKHNTLTLDEQTSLIVEQVKQMNKEYLRDNRIQSIDDKDNLEKQLRQDLQYIAFMAPRIIALILEPFRCMVVEA